MDQIDKMLISLLQENARMPLKELAQKVFLSSPAVSTRLERLEKIGVITGYSARVDRLKLGYHITAFINLALMQEERINFCEFIKNIPNVLECNSLTGEYNILIKVVFKSTLALEGFIGRLQIYGKTKTQIVFSSIVQEREIREEGL